MVREYSPIELEYMYVESDETRKKELEQAKSGLVWIDRLNLPPHPRAEAAQKTTNRF